MIKRKQQQKKGVKGDQAKDRSQQRKEQTMQRESALKRDREKTAQQTKSKKYNVGVSKGGVPFKEAFGYYRGKGQSEFTWNGKKYTTKLASGKTPTPASAAIEAAGKPTVNGFLLKIEPILNPVVCPFNNSFAIGPVGPTCGLNAPLGVKNSFNLPVTPKLPGAKALDALIPL